MRLSHFQILMSFVFFVIATFLFVKGYRDADTALNLYIIKHYTGMEFVDIGIFGQTFTIEELYKIGLGELFFSFIFYLLSVGFAVIATFVIMDGEKCGRRNNIKLDNKKNIR
jgi:hypothetical protein